MFRHFAMACLVVALSVWTSGVFARGGGHGGAHGGRVAGAHPGGAHRPGTRTPGHPGAAQHREMKHDRRDLRHDQRDLRHDERNLRNDRRDLRHDRFQLRQNTPANATPAAAGPIFPSGGWGNAGSVRTNSSPSAK